MAQTDPVPSESTRTDVQVGLVVADHRTGDRKQVIYADSRTVLIRDEEGSTTLVPRRAFDRELGTRYQVRPDATPDIDGGQYDRLRDRLAEYDERDGRKARHKADALREALDLLGGDPDAEPDPDDPDATAGDREVPFEEIAGVGPETASALRSRGLVTVADVDAASDDVLSSVSGVGPDTVARIRAFVADDDG